MTKRGLNIDHSTITSNTGTSGFNTRPKNGKVVWLIDEE